MSASHVVLREDDERSARLVADGWAVLARSWAAHVEATPVNVRRWSEAAAALTDVTCRELCSDDVPAVLRLDAATAADYPGGVATAHEPLTAASATPSATRRGFGIFDDDAYVVAVTFVDVDADRAEVDFTVVAKHRRGSGLATTLKAASLLALSRDGVEVFRTGGSAENRAILAANARLGFEVDEHWVTLTPSA